MRQIESLTYVVKVEEIVRCPVDLAVEELQAPAHIALVEAVFAGYHCVGVLGIRLKCNASEDVSTVA